jgi:phospholipid transport system substrate-binding protein
MQLASYAIHSRRILIGTSLLACLGVALHHGTTQAASPKKAAKGAKAEAGEASESAAAISLPPPGSSPMSDLKKSNAALKKLFQRQPPSWSPEEDVKRTEMRKIMNGFLDVDELSHRILARHWEGLKPKQRTEFVGLLRDLIERSYIKQVHGQPNYDLRFRKESITGSEATVNATLDISNGGKKAAIEEEYKLLFKGSRWLAYDVITDEQSTLENYRAEFNKIITKESFDALLKRMKKKLEKAE